MTVCERTCAKAATSHIQDGVESFDSGEIWIVTKGCVILVVCHPYLETDRSISFLRRHISSAFRQFPFTAQLNNLVAHPVGQALQEEIPGLGEVVAFDVKYIYANVKENNFR